jgi:hypothetical protein
MLKQGLIATPKAYFFSIPMLLGLAIFMLVWEAPGVLRDYAISVNPVTLTDGDISDGKCSTQRGFFTDCSAHLRYSYKGQSYENDVDIMFVDFHAGDYETDLVISADHPELSTLSLGIDMLWDRIITLGILALLLGGMGVGMIFFTLRIWRVVGQLRHPAELIPVPVEVTAFDRRRNRLSVTYADKVSARKTGRSALTRFETGQEPLIVGKAGGKAVALAVWHGKASLPVLLDRGLERIELTADERARALASLPPALISDAQPILVEQPKKAGMSIMKRLGIWLAVILLAVVGFFGYWLWYVTSAESAFNSPGMDINNMMPAAINSWGCDQLKKRFGNERAPFGCVAADYTSWK